ncbi:MAG: hypothetical protein JWN47_2965 [Frankiales bacterium]|nr:hypothetical protein [Frankiales bacterium]
MALQPLDRHGLLRLRARMQASPCVLWLTVFLPLAALYLLTLRTNPMDMSADPSAVTPTAWELAHHWTPRLPASLEPFGYHNDWLIPSGTGQLVSNREPGLVFLAAPFYWLCSAAGVGNVIPASAAAALLTAAAAATLSLIARRFVSAEVAAVAALIAGTATTTWAVSGTALWPHGPDQLYLAVSMAGTASGSFAVSGIALAAAILTRPPLAIVAAVTGIWESLARRRWRPALTIGACAAAGLVVLLSYSRTYWSGGLDSQYAAAGGGFVRPFFDLGPAAVGRFAVNILGTFLSPGRGVLWGAPFLLVLAPGLRPAWRVAPPWVRSAALGGALYLIVQLKGNRFSGGDRFWSYRYPLETLTLLFPLLVIAWNEWACRTPRRRGAFFALVWLSVALQAIGALCFRGPYAGKPWLPLDLVAALIGPRSVVAGTLLVVGFFGAGLVYRRCSRRGCEAVDSGPTAAAPGD